MNDKERLLSVDPKRHKTLRELAYIHRYIELCKKRLYRTRNWELISLADEEGLYNRLERVTAEVYRISCNLLGMPSARKK
ncbi:MAG: hypothetical protein IKP06_06765 [Elusimicrobiaceae bacterium]|nr:hypothetical protein [Elusimicrobiaceae bacterium]